MKFLVVDDDSSKRTQIQRFLIEQGLHAGEIEEAEHASGARMILERSPVDVLLIDVLLPVRAGGLPRGENSVELLRQIVDDGTTPSPRYIIGITADVDALNSFSRDFGALMTQVLYVAPGETAWQDSLKALLLLLRRVEDARGHNDFDVCILNALRSPELVAVYRVWPLNLGAEKIVRKNILCRTGTVTLEGRELKIVCAHLAQMGPIASTHATTALLSEYRPRLLLMTGICGGFADQVDIGDVVVADKSWDWQAGKWADDGTLATAPDQRDASPDLVAEARGLDAELLAAHSTFVGARPERVPRLLVGPMVTGSSVVASLDIQKVFRGQHRKMAAVDMECYGLYYAAENHADAPVRAICIKAVSDLADRSKSDDFQRYCSEMSAHIALKLAQRFFLAT